VYSVSRCLGYVWKVTEVVALPYCVLVRLKEEEPVCITAIIT